MNVTLDLPEEIIEHAEVLAERTGRQANDVMAEALTGFLKPITSFSTHRKPLTECTDEEVISLWNSHFPESTEARFSELAELRQLGTITKDDENEYLGLLEQYKDGMLLKAQALAESVRRGLLPPLDS